MGLDQPIWWRYFGWLGHVLQGDFGRSFRTGQTVLQAVTERLPVSLELMLLAEIMGLAIGVPLAIVCAVRSGGAVRPFHDRHRLRHAVGADVPVGDPADLSVRGASCAGCRRPAMCRSPKIRSANLRFFVLPALTLALAEWPGIMRVLRSDMIATLQEDYIALAKAKGLKAVAHPVRACA